MSTYAIIETGGKQYRVEQGQSLLVDRLPADEGAKVALRALMLRTEDDVVLQPPDLEKVKVEAKVAGHERGEKVQVFKYKAKKGYRRRRGHRSELTRLEVTEVKQLSRKPAGTKADAGEKGDAKDEGAEKQEAPKKAAPKKVAEKKDTPKKAAPKKSAAGSKTGASKTATKQAPAKKAPAKASSAKKSPSKQSGSGSKQKKAAAKKPSTKKADTEKESD